MTITTDYIRTSLQAVYGESVTAADIRAWCAMNGSNYQTITNKLTDYKVGRGKWNLEVTKETVEELETTYNGPAALPAVEQNLIPAKDDSFVQFGNFTDIKKIVSLIDFLSSDQSNGITGKLISALWDNWIDFKKHRKILKKYTHI